MSEGRRAELYNKIQAGVTGRITAVIYLDRLGMPQALKERLKTLRQETKAELPVSTPATSVIALIGPVGRMPTFRPKSEARGRALEVVLWAEQNTPQKVSASRSRARVRVAYKKCAA